MLGLRAYKRRSVKLYTFPSVQTQAYQSGLSEYLSVCLFVYLSIYIYIQRLHSVEKRNEHVVVAQSCDMF